MQEAPPTNRTGLAAAIAGAVAALFVVALVLDLGPFADEDLSAPEFLAQADGVCAQAHEDFLEVQSSVPRTPEDAADQVEALVQIAEDERDAIADLGAPEAVAEDLDNYLAERDRGIATLKEGLEAARADDPAAYERAQAKLAAEQRKRASLARELGLTECSQPLVSDAELERQSQLPGD